MTANKKQAFKFILKNKTNDHSVDSKILIDLFKDLNNFVDSTIRDFEKSEGNKTLVYPTPKINVVAFEKSSFKIDFEIVSDDLFNAITVPKVIDSIENLFIDISNFSSDDFEHKVIVEKKYSPKQINNFLNLSETIIKGGYDLIYENPKTNNTVVVDEKSQSSFDSMKSTLNKFIEENINRKKVSGTFVSVDTVKNTFSFVINENEPEILKGKFNDDIFTQLKNNSLTIEVPSKQYILIEQKLKTDFRSKNGFIEDYTLIKILKK